MRTEVSRQLLKGTETEVGSQPLKGTNVRLEVDRHLLKGTKMMIPNVRTEIT